MTVTDTVKSIPELERQLAGAKMRANAAQMALERCRMNRVHAERKLAEDGASAGGMLTASRLATRTTEAQREPELVKAIADAESDISTTESLIASAKERVADLEPKAVIPADVQAAIDELAALKGE